MSKWVQLVGCKSSHLRILALTKTLQEEIKCSSLRKPPPRTQSKYTDNFILIQISWTLKENESFRLILGQEGRLSLLG